MRSLKQLLCAHWFDEKPTEEYNISQGPIICTEQRQFTVTVLPRVCYKCGLTEKREINRVFEGWN